MLGDDSAPVVHFFSTNFARSDGGNFAMDWRNRDDGQPDLPADAPTVLVIHGLNGHSEEACVLYSMVCVFVYLFAPFRLHRRQ